MVFGHSTKTAKGSAVNRFSHWCVTFAQAALGILIGLCTLSLSANFVLPKFLMADVEGPPVMVVGPTSIDFGVVRPGTELRGQVSVSNRGKQRLVLHELMGPCKCVGNPKSAIIVPAGASLILPVTFRVHAPSPTPMGTPEQFIVQFDSSDPVRGMLLVTLLAEVRAEHDQKHSTTVEAKFATSHFIDH